MRSEVSEEGLMHGLGRRLDTGIHYPDVSALHGHLLQRADWTVWERNLLNGWTNTESFQCLFSLLSIIYFFNQASQNYVTTHCRARDGLLVVEATLMNSNCPDFRKLSCTGRSTLNITLTPVVGRR
jgi:hypothetical protein